MVYKNVLNVFVDMDDMLQCTNDYNVIPYLNPSSKINVYLSIGRMLI